MKASYHVVASAGVAMAYHSVVQSWPATMVCFLSGILIDLDHYLEYIMFEKKIPYRYKELLNFFDEARSKKIHLVFHGYEYLILIWLGIYYFNLGIISIGFALGLTVHILFDQFTNPIKPLFYFLTYRIIYKFDRAKMLTI